MRLKVQEKKKKKPQYIFSFFLRCSFFYCVFPITMYPSYACPSSPQSPHRENNILVLSTQPGVEKALRKRLWLFYISQPPLRLAKGHEVSSGQYAA